LEDGCYRSSCNQYRDLVTIEDNGYGMHIADGNKKI
jgi:hypothetical protein